MTCYGYTNLRLNAFDGNEQLDNNGSLGAIAVSDDLVAIFYQEESRLIYNVKKELLARDYSHQRVYR